MSKRSIVAALSLAAGLTLAGTATASAHVSGDPTPYPTPTQQVCDQSPAPVYLSAYHGNRPSPRPQCRPALWQFDFTGSQIDGLTLNDVRGVGAIPMSRWQETDVNPFVSEFSRGANNVFLLHQRLPFPNINLGTCTATFDQVGTFRVLRGAGTGANFRVVPGTSQYILRGLVSVDLVQRHGYLDRRHHRQNVVCPLQFVNPFTLRALVEQSGINHTPLRIAGQLAQLVDFDVQGNAQLVRNVPVIPTPYPTGPGGHFAPTATPSDSLLPA